ncbi:MAG: nuclear transport factor 2 family protein [Betaproteobacteria bacterium]|jgi:SnoaL-like domain|nr:nuclear transport factor 2 family protein [Polynucleobacter sp.]NBY63889.1 nuclear transport factor 2 family protein [Betaproteobacteria bacterium]
MSSTQLDELIDKQLIRDVVENWVVWRDSGQWDKFRTVWHSDGVMMATWFQGSFEEFIRVTIEGWNKGVSILHFLGGTSVELNKHRAISQTKMTITQRGLVDGAMCDVVCTGRFYDFMEKRNGIWGVVLRQPIYEKDRINPLDPSISLQLDQELLNSFPEGYRHLAYIQTKLGFQVKEDMPQLKGSAVESLYQKGKDWLNV